MSLTQNSYICVCAVFSSLVSAVSFSGQRWRIRFSLDDRISPIGSQYEHVSVLLFSIKADV